MLYIIIVQREYDSVICIYRKNKIDTLKENKIRSLMVSTVVSFSGVGALLVYSYRFKEQINQG